MKKRLVFFALAIALMFVLASPMVYPVTVSGYNQLQPLRLGFPLPYLEQQVTLTPFDSDFPLTLRMQSPLENPSTILWGNLLLDVVLVAGMLFVLWLLTKVLLARFV
ncbi:MAG: hypothetical protein SCK29_10860 [Bacillota bacterium]|nr:hypothetical protein [Bacillota bacterium]MDW7684603.1 hypothetical protein [Bacillota bacterium]